MGYDPNNKIDSAEMPIIKYHIELCESGGDEL